MVYRKKQPNVWGAVRPTMWQFGFGRESALPAFFMRRSHVLLSLVRRNPTCARPNPNMCVWATTTLGLRFFPTPSRRPREDPPQSLPPARSTVVAHSTLAAPGERREDCLLFGSRGGQVVLPHVWRSLGDKTPPAVVINGGCSMGLPKPAAWPRGAVTLLLMGGQDNFRGSMSPEDRALRCCTWLRMHSPA